MKRYSLWLDESGTFKKEDQTDNRRNPSLIGGILIEQGRIDQKEIDEWTGTPADEGFAHATGYGKEEANNIVFPALKYVVDKGGKLVYFENKERIDKYDNVELYLRLLSQGMVKLVRKLAMEGDIILDVSIASRRSSEERSRRIEDKEILGSLRDYIKAERAKGTFELKDGDTINIAIQSARRESHLQMADFACNARLTRKSAKYAEVREQLEELFDEDYIFSFSVKTAQNRIEAMIAEGDISAALYEIYTGTGTYDREQMKQETMELFHSLSYRLQRLKLNTFVSDIVGYARNETDFERGERIISEVIADVQKFIPEDAVELQVDEALFRLNEWLLDMYAREGNVIKVGRAIRLIADIVKKMNYRAENLIHLYKYNDRKALYEINCMEYEKAMESMDKTIRTIQDIIAFFDQDENTRAYFGKGHAPESEYLGDAYCMKLYAGMFLQKSKPEIYESLCKDTETGLQQYHYEGERERTQQYRAHIEMVQGNYASAFEWLMRSAGIPGEGKEIAAQCDAYLRKAGEEDALSRAYYLMYYVELMYESLAEEDRVLSDAMYSVLEKHTDICDEFFRNDGKQSNIMRTSEDEPEIHEDIAAQILGKEKKSYHPREILLWKYALYLWKSGTDRRGADNTFLRAVKTCSYDKEYTMMYIIALAIGLDWICYRCDMGMEMKTAVAAVQNKIGEMDNNDDLPIKFREYVDQTKEIIDATKKGGLSKAIRKQAEELAQKIAF